MADSTTESYAKSGFAQKMGWGARPALVLIDVCTAYWSTGSPLDTSTNPESVKAPESMRKLVAAARSANSPVIWTKVYYDRPNMADAGLMYKKAKALTVWQKGDTRGFDDYVEGLVPEEGDIIIVKKMPSAFFGTTLAADLHLLNVDTCRFSSFRNLEELLKDWGCLGIEVGDAVWYLLYDLPCTDN